MLSDIQNIPKIMRANGMMKGAALMERWFRRPAVQQPKFDPPPDTTTIKMEWTLAFARAKAVFEDDIVRDKLWANKASVDEATGRLKKLAAPIGRFDFSRKSPVWLHANHFNFRDVGHMLDDNDDLKAALGQFAFYLVPLTGDYVMQGSRPTVIFSKVGVMVYDKYDFGLDGENQWLGCWNETNNTVRMVSGTPSEWISNKTFRDWRVKHLKGGDFEIFSDVMPLMLGGAPFSAGAAFTA